MKNTNSGQIILAGAGPGDPELITIKGLKAIQNADFILYDALVNEELLNHNHNAEKIFVGKRKGWKKHSQETINEMLISYASKGLNVLRLKGGDPMIFGRAYDEMAAARRNNIALEIIPGISAYSGMAAYNQVPVTQRCINESLWICTGTTCKGTISDDLQWAARSSATVIVYMGMGKLAEIVDTFKMYKPGNYPSAIIQNATTHKEKVIVGDLNSIVALRDKSLISNPALIIFGSAAKEVVKREFRKELLDHSIFHEAENVSYA